MYSIFLVFASDNWCLGLLLYELVTGTTPFMGTDCVAIFRSILTCRVEWPDWIMSETDDKIIKNGKDLVTKLLLKDPDKRLGTKNETELVDHPFFKGGNTKYNKKQLEFPPTLSKE